MTWRERLALAIAWRLPRRWAYWAFIRVSTVNVAGNPGDQTVGDVAKARLSEGWK